jgi:hypothetical protein
MFSGISVERAASVLVVEEQLEKTGMQQAQQLSLLDAYSSTVKMKA